MAVKPRPGMTTEALAEWFTAQGKRIYQNRHLSIEGLRFLA